MSCLTPTAQADGVPVVTIEGLASKHLHPVQERFPEEFAVQCGFAITPFLVAATLLEENKQPIKMARKLIRSGRKPMSMHWVLLDN